MILPRKESVGTAIPATTAMSSSRSLPPVLGRLLSGTFWLALRVPLQILLALWTTRLVVETIGGDQWGAYRFAWGFSFFQILFEFAEHFGKIDSGLFPEGGGLGHGTRSERRSVGLWRRRGGLLGDRGR